jgi:hypothetical protein
MKKLFMFPLFLLFIGCQPGESDFIEAIEQYYEESNRNTGSGRFRIAYVEIMQVDRENKRVLAKAVGSYSNTTVNNVVQNEHEEHVLWYFYEEGKVHLKIKAIRTPEQLRKHLE